MLETLEKEGWLSVRTVPAFLELLSNGWLKVERASSLLYDIGKTCPWAYQYLLLPGRLAQFCDLETMQIQSSSITNPCSPGGVFVPLPSGDYFLCGGPSSNCYMIDRNYKDIRSAGEMVVARVSAGAVHFHDRIYVFGGMIIHMDAISTQTAERYNFKEQTSVLLGNEMRFPRHGFQPCVWEEKVYLFEGMTDAGEIFDPDMETFRTLPISFGFTGPALLCPGVNQILVLAGRICSYRHAGDRLEVLAYGNDLFLSFCVPIQYKGKFYFTIRKESELFVSSFDPLTYKLEITNEKVPLSSC